MRGAAAVSSLVLVVDDGSEDETAAIAADAGAQVLRHSSNRGKGAALLSGMRWLFDRGFTHAATMDGDGQHMASEIPLLLAVASREPRALVIGVRRLESMHVAAINLFANRLANRWIERASGRSIPDTQSGFRIYPLCETLALGIRSGHFAFETEVLIRAARSGLPIRSVPVRVYYPNPAQRVSHYRKFRDTIRIAAVVLRLFFARRRAGSNRMGTP